MIFFLKQTCHSQTGGRGGPPLGKNSHIFPFFYLGSVPKGQRVFDVSNFAPLTVLLHANKNVFDQKFYYCNDESCLVVFRKLFISIHRRQTSRWGVREIQREQEPCLVQPQPELQNQTQSEETQKTQFVFQVSPSWLTSPSYSVFNIYASGCLVHLSVFTYFLLPALKLILKSFIPTFKT